MLNMLSHFYAKPIPQILICYLGTKKKKKKGSSCCQTTVNIDFYYLFISDNCPFQGKDDDTDDEDDQDEDDDEDDGDEDGN